MKRMSRTLAAIAIATPIVSVLAPNIGTVAIAPFVATAAAAKEDSLYQRLGGYDALVAFTDDFIGRLLADPTFERFFPGFSTDSKKRLRQDLVDFLCEKTGGPCFYFGRDMKTAHAGLAITKAEWDRSLVLIGETMTALKIPEKEQQELASLVVPLEKDIVEKP
jgi:hemoglobin